MTVIPFPKKTPIAYTMDDFLAGQKKNIECTKRIADQFFLVKEYELANEFYKAVRHLQNAYQMLEE